MTPARSTAGSKACSAAFRLGVDPCVGGVAAVEPDGVGFVVVGLGAIGLGAAGLRDVERGGVGLTWLELGGVELPNAEVVIELSGVTATGGELGGATVVVDGHAGAKVSGSEELIQRVEAVDTGTVEAGSDALVDVHAAVAAAITTQPAISRRPHMRYHGRRPTGTMDQ